MLKVFQ